MQLGSEVVAGAVVVATEWFCTPVAYCDGPGDLHSFRNMFYMHRKTEAMADDQVHGFEVRDWIASRRTLVHWYKVA